MRNYFRDYSENSRSAILRVAILVAYSDDRLHRLERVRLEESYKNICRWLDADIDDELLRRELDTIESDTRGEIDNLDSDEEREEYWQKCISSIVSRDVQQLTVLSAHHIADGDSELTPNEASGISRLCDVWGIDLKNTLALDG